MFSIPSLCRFHHLELTTAIQQMAVECFAEIQAHEGTLWLLDESRESLIPIWNSGPKSEEFVGTFRQPLDSGLISLSCVTEQAICENQVCLNERQDPTLDRRLGLRTWSMIAVPLVFHDSLRGIISCVKLGESAEPSLAPRPFTPGNLHQVERLSEQLNHLINAQADEMTLG